MNFTPDASPTPTSPRYVFPLCDVRWTRRVVHIEALLRILSILASRSRLSRSAVYNSVASLGADEVSTLDALMEMLGSPLPWFDTELLHPRRLLRHHEATTPVVLATSGNWYDIIHKAKPLAQLARELPMAELILTGGRSERLTSFEAQVIGGESVLLRQALVDLQVPSPLHACRCPHTECLSGHCIRAGAPRTNDCLVRLPRHHT